MIKIQAQSNNKISKIISNQDIKLSYSTLMKTLRKKDVKVNGKRVREDVSVLKGDIIEIFVPEIQKDSFFVVFQDQNVLVINKFKGYNSEDVFDILKKENSDLRFIHRLDRNTSGLMIFAKNETAEKELLSGFKKRTFEKTYTAVVKGKMPKKEDILTAYLVKDSLSSTVKIFDKKTAGSVLIKTGYKVISENTDTSVVSVRLYTGKTHQIRAHLSYIGNPILGDEKYGDSAFNKLHGKKTQELTATSLTLHFDKDSPLFYLDLRSFNI